MNAVEKNAALRLDGLIERVRGETRQLEVVRDAARSTVFEALRRIERHLCDALDGDKLRAYTLSRRFGSEAPTLRGVRITGAFPGALLPTNSPQIVLRDDGTFVRATFAFRELHIEPLEEEHVRAEHLEMAIERTQHALQMHLSRVERTTEGYERAERLAAKLAEVLPPTF